MGSKNFYVLGTLCAIDEDMVQKELNERKGMVYLSNMDALVSSAWDNKRKLRLFAVACCRKINHLMTDERSKVAVGIAELYADKLVSLKTLVDAHYDAIRVTETDKSIIEQYAAWSAANVTGTHTVMSAKDTVRTAILASRHNYYDLFREIIPFREIKREFCFLNKDVQNIAKSIYNDNNYKETYILADALQDAGYNGNLLLDHLYEKNHVKGCWAIDSILGLL